MRWLSTLHAFGNEILRVACSAAMGNNLTNPMREYPWLFVSGPEGQPGYDNAGYVPDGMTYKHQNSYSEAYNYGGNVGMRFFAKLFPDVGNESDYWWDWGATEGILTSFGTTGNHYARLYDTNTPAVGLQRWDDGRFASVKRQPAPYATWAFDQFKPTKDQVCTPHTFPNCNMQPMMDAGGEAGFFDHTSRTAGRVYRDSVDRAYTNFFLSDGPESLQQVNTSEHSTFDPCDNPSLIDLLLPVVTGGALVVVYAYYGKPELSLAIGSAYAGYLDFVLFGFGYNLAKGLLEYFSDPDNVYTERAVRILLLPVAAAGGAYAGSLIAQELNADDALPYQVALAVGIIMAANKSLIPLLAKIISGSTFVVAIVLNGLNFLLKGFSRWVCQLTANLDSCEAWDDPQNGLQDSRRWDSVSVASKLTLEVCEREGWKKDDPRAEFVFRGLLTGPAMQTAATTQENPSNFAQTLVNPLGFIYAGRWMQQPTVWKWGVMEDPITLFSRSQNIIGWDGNVAEWSDQSEANLYSCENWDIMRDNLQQKSSPNALQLKNNFDKWVGNWANPEQPGELVVAAYDPANIVKMYGIPGFEARNSTPTIPIVSKPISLDRTTLPFEPQPILKIAPFTSFVPTETALTFLESPAQSCTWWYESLLNGTNYPPTTTIAQYNTMLLQLFASPVFATCDDTSYIKEQLMAVQMVLSGQFANQTELEAHMQNLGWDSNQITNGVLGLYSFAAGQNAVLANYLTAWLAGKYLSELPFEKQPILDVLLLDTLSYNPNFCNAMWDLMVSGGGANGPSSWTTMAEYYANLNSWIFSEDFKQCDDSSYAKEKILLTQVVCIGITGLQDLDSYMNNQTPAWTTAQQQAAMAGLQKIAASSTAGPISTWVSNAIASN